VRWRAKSRIAAMPRARRPGSVASGAVVWSIGEVIAIGLYVILRASQATPSVRWLRIALEQAVVWLWFRRIVLDFAVVWL
jgi:hypothetical protein